jgi:hypothetical protein
MAKELPLEEKTRFSKCKLFFSPDFFLLIENVFLNTDGEDEDHD